ncbi:MAG: hypothetical protein LBD68_01030, partial [Zoogloeaceae bacterium]|nr:hypothetical protein [Zoogloeaceae bacterium]
NTSPSRTSIALINPGELQRQLAQLPVDDACAALEEITEWLNACQLGEVIGNTRFQIVRLLDEAAQPRIRTLTGEYLSERQSRDRENQLWTLLYGALDKIARQYEICIKNVIGLEKGADAARAQLALAVTCAIAAWARAIRLKGFCYSPVDNDYWGRLGAAYLLAEREGFAQKPLQTHTGRGGITSPFAEYLQILIFHVSSLDCLLPQEIDLADSLIAHAQTKFVFSAEKSAQSVWWLDAAKAMPPTRLNDAAQISAPTLRFFHPGDAQARLNMLAQEIRQSNDVPARLGLDSSVSAQQLLPVIQHLAACWMPTPPQRQHTRHRVKHQMVVLPGFINAFIIVSPEFGGNPAGLPQETWIADNVSQGGFGAIVKEVKGDWLGIGALLAIQPGGEGSWLVGLVRRYQRISEQEVRVGIETLSRRIASVDVGPRASTLPPSIPALWLQDDNPRGDIRFVLPRNTFNAKESLEFDYSGRRIVLTPVSLLEQGGDFEIATYRAAIAATPKV